MEGGNKVYIESSKVFGDSAMTQLLEHLETIPP